MHTLSVGLNVNPNRTFEDFMTIYIILMRDGNRLRYYHVSFRTVDYLDGTCGYLDTLSDALAICKSLFKQYKDIPIDPVIDFFTEEWERVYALHSPDPYEPC